MLTSIDKNDINERSFQEFENFRFLLILKQRREGGGKYQYMPDDKFLKHETSLNGALCSDERDKLVWLVNGSFLRGPL